MLMVIYFDRYDTHKSTKKMFDGTIKELEIQLFLDCINGDIEFEEEDGIPELVGKPITVELWGKHEEAIKKILRKNYIGGSPRKFRKGKDGIYGMDDDEMSFLAIEM